MPNILRNSVIDIARQPNRQGSPVKDAVDGLRGNITAKTDMGKMRKKENLRGHKISANSPLWKKPLKGLAIRPEIFYNEQSEEAAKPVGIIQRGYGARFQKDYHPADDGMQLIKGKPLRKEKTVESSSLAHRHHDRSLQDKGRNPSCTPNPLYQKLKNAGRKRL